VEALRTDWDHSNCLRERWACRPHRRTGVRVASPVCVGRKEQPLGRPTRRKRRLSVSEISAVRSDGYRVGLLHVGVMPDPTTRVAKPTRIL
jgi:hypothetical protein